MNLRKIPPKTLAKNIATQHIRSRPCVVAQAAAARQGLKPGFPAHQVPYPFPPSHTRCGILKAASAAFILSRRSRTRRQPTRRDVGSGHDARQSTTLGFLRACRRRIEGTDAEWLLAHARQAAQLHCSRTRMRRLHPRSRSGSTLVARREGGEPAPPHRQARVLDLRACGHAGHPDPAPGNRTAGRNRAVEAAGRVGRAHRPRHRQRAIALAVASERPSAQVVATDCSEAALRVARGNARGAGIRNIEFRTGDWCAAAGP